MTLWILLYHNFLLHDRDIPYAINPRFTTSLSRFERQLDFLLNAQYIPIDIDRVYSSPLKMDGNYFLITFDGGYPGWELAATVLANRRLPATFYVVSDWISSRSHPTSTQNQIPRTLLLDLHSNGLFKIGSHSKTHSKECFFNNTTSDPTILYEELLQSKDSLENVIGAHVVDFAVPWGGIFNQSIETRASSCGYRSVRWAMPGVWRRHTNSDCGNLLRLPVSYSDTASMPLHSFRWIIESWKRSRISRALLSGAISVELALRKRLSLHPNLFHDEPM